MKKVPSSHFRKDVVIRDEPVKKAAPVKKKKAPDQAPPEEVPENVEEFGEKKPEEKPKE
jgi:hypothetical protein